MRSALARKGVVLACVLLLTVPASGGFLEAEVGPDPASPAGDDGAASSVPPPTGAREVRIVRDNYGVPHVFADSKEAMAYGAGYAMARDRLFQGDLFRRAGKGQLSGLLGEDFLAYDKAWRTTHYTEEELWEMYQGLEQPLKDMLKAYTQGWNRYLAEAYANPVKKMPVEYAALGAAPEPWNVTDSVAIIVLQVDAFGQGGGSELSNLALLRNLVERYGDKEKAWKVFNDVKWINDPGAPVTVPREQSSGSLDNTTYEDPGPEPPQDVLDQLRVAPPQPAQQYRQRILDPILHLDERGVETPHFGSNAFLVSEEQSETGNALLYGGPQVGYNVPGLFTELGLHAPGIDALGISFAGVGPCVPIGVSTDHAWTTTSGISDNIDIVRETVRRNASGGLESKHGDQWEPVEVLHQRIVVNEPATSVLDGIQQDAGDLVQAAQGLPDSLEEVREEPDDTPPPAQVVPHTVYRTVHGPIVVGDPGTLEPGEQGTFYSRQVTYWKDDLRTAEGFCSFQSADDTQDLVEGTAEIVSSHNLLFADDEGNIIFWHAGRFPNRTEVPADVRFPRNGSDPAEDLGSMLSNDELPHSVNPPQGWLANWNNKPAVGWDNGDGANFGIVDEYRDVQEKMREINSSGDGEFSMEELAEVGRDVALRHLPDNHIYRYMTKYIREVETLARAMSEDRVAEAADLVLQWDGKQRDTDGDGRYDAPGLPILGAWYDAIRHRIYDDELGSRIVDEWVSRSHVVHALEGENSTLPLSQDYLDGEPRSMVALRAMRTALDRLETRFGTQDPATWREPVHQTEFSPMGGYSVPPIQEVDRGTYVQVADMGEPVPRGWSVNPPGEDGLLSPARFARIQAGQPPSQVNPHLQDQRALYANWNYKTMPLSSEQVAALGTSQRTLVYPSGS